MNPAKIDPKELASALGFKTDGPETGHHLRDLIPQYSRIQIPLDNVVCLRHYADLLRGLAAALDHASRLPGLSDTQILFIAKGEVKSTQSKILHMYKRSVVE